MKDYLTLTAEKFHLRTSHSVLHGYWTVELGGVNQVVHLWEYGKYLEFLGYLAVKISFHYRIIIFQELFL